MLSDHSLKYGYQKISQKLDEISDEFQWQSQPFLKCFCEPPFKGMVLLQVFASLVNL